MSKFIFSNKQKKTEIKKILLRNLKKERLFILLLGPSSTGKTTIIQELLSQNSDLKFEYVKPIMTRPNRSNETDKISVTDQEFNVLEKNKKFVAVNSLYGVRYGTLLSGILNPLERGIIPILDYPIDKISNIQNPAYDTLNFYIYPPSTEIWTQRLNDVDRNNNGRLESGKKELDRLILSNFIHPDIHISIVNKDNSAKLVAKNILQIIKDVTN